jgi:hypothetical protein
MHSGSVSLEAGLQDMLIRMESGRFKVFKHLNDWFDGFRLYHRKDGKVHKEGNDLMSVTRYAVMMLRHARTAEAFSAIASPQGCQRLECDCCATVCCDFIVRWTYSTQSELVLERPVRCEEGAGSCRRMQPIVRSRLPLAPDEQDWRVHQR